MPRCAKAMSADLRLPMVLRVEDWPEVDRAMAAANTAIGDDLDDPVYVATHKPQTVTNALKGWGRFLAVLRDLGRLDPKARPSDRATRKNINAFVRAMRKAGNKGASIAVRLFDVRAALRILEPGRDAEFAWTVRPHGRCAWVAFRSEKKAFPVFHPRKLMLFGIEMMRDASVDLTVPKNLIAYRNGLIFAVGAASGLRLGSLAALRLGDHIRRTPDAWHLDLSPKDVKNSASLEFDLWKDLTPWIDRYADVVRPGFGATSPVGPFWVIEGGSPLTYRGLDGAICRTSRKFEGTTFGSHTLRRSAGTAGPLAAPDRPTAMAAMLGISQGVLERHYNLGNTAEAARQFQEAIKAERGGNAMPYTGKGTPDSQQP